jgi:uncharacterized protein YvpB
MTKEKLFIEVPILRQEPGSVDCGIVCMQMVYGYFGESVSFSQLKVDLPTTKIGTYTPQLGSHFQEHGFNTELVTLNPKLFHLNDSEKPLGEMRSHFENLKTNAENENDQLILGFFTEYLGKGGVITPAIPTEGHIRQALSEGNLVMAVLNTTPLYEGLTSTSWQNAFHIVVITGIDEEFVYLNDPNFTESGGQTKHPQTNFFFSLYASSLTDPDNGSLLIVKKKK